MMSPLPMFVLPIFVFVVLQHAHGSEQLPPLDGVVHEGLVVGLFLTLDGHQGVFSKLGGHVARGISRPTCRHEAILCCRLLQLLGFVALENGVDAPFAQQESLGFF